MTSTKRPLKPSTSPYFLNADDAEVLEQSDGFKILREHLGQTCDYELCKNHTTKQSNNLSQWLAVRDVLHALLVPVVELFDKAITLAVAATHATKAEDLEYAFTGQARSAFLWVQCFLWSEKGREWCYTKGCPACVVEHSLDSEFTVRMLYTACLLSDVHYPFTLEGPRLPSFRFFLEHLERAVSTDPLYGQEFFERMQPKAVTTRNGIEDLIHQCVELEDSLTRPSSPSDGTSESESAVSSVESSPVLGPLGARPSSQGSGVKLKRSRTKSKEMSLQMEEQQWMEEMVKRCWEQIQLGDDDGGIGTSIPQSLGVGGGLKGEATVAVTEVQSAG